MTKQPSPTSSPMTAQRQPTKYDPYKDYLPDTRFAQLDVTMCNIALRDGDKTLEQMAKEMGVNAEWLQDVLENE